MKLKNDALFYSRKYALWKWRIYYVIWKQENTLPFQDQSWSPFRVFFNLTVRLFTWLELLSLLPNVSWFLKFPCFTSKLFCIFIILCLCFLFIFSFQLHCVPKSFVPEIYSSVQNFIPLNFIRLFYKLENILLFKTYPLIVYNKFLHFCLKTMSFVFLWH